MCGDKTILLTEKGFETRETQYKLQSIENLHSGRVAGCRSDRQFPLSDKRERKRRMGQKWTDHRERCGKRSTPQGERSQPGGVPVGCGIEKGAARRKRNGLENRAPPSLLKGR